MICKYCETDSEACFADDFWDDDLCIECAEEIKDRKEMIE